ncbi:hypothetical protein ACJMK2_040186, partial [Sinanodonta woodiana]
MTSVLAAASLDPERDANHMTSVLAAASLDPEIDTNHMTSVLAAASLDPEIDTTISSDMTKIVKRNKIRITPPNRHTQTPLPHEYPWHATEGSRIMVPFYRVPDLFTS